MPRPRLPVPPALRGAEPHSFAEHTIRHRLPQIARRLCADNTLSEPAVTCLQALLAEMPHGLIRPVADPLAPDLSLWQHYVTPYLAHDWLQAPWFFAETYFYRRIAAAVAFFETERDPFAAEKQLSLGTTVARSRTLAAQGQALQETGWQAESVQHLLLLALWGNQADLSLWAPGDVNQPHHADAESQEAHLLINDAAAVAAYLTTVPAPRRLDILVDNAGFELLGDLCLVDYCLATGQVQQVCLHLKRHPTFVSDAMEADVHATVAFLTADADAALRALGARLASHLLTGRLQLHSHMFWTSPLPLWQLPEELRLDLASASLVISKGDAHYRRAVGDAHWPYTTPLPDVVSHFPVPLVFLRTCKAEVLVGLPASQVHEVSRRDTTWLTNGKWGLIQFVLDAPRIS